MPGCPGWTLVDLARHLGGVHRWARDAVVVGRSPEQPGPPDPAQVEPWFREGAALLLTALRERHPDTPCWTFAEPRTVAFWLRRQAHETALHRCDAAQALGRTALPDDDVAEDGVDEVCTVFVPRQVRLGRLAPSRTVLALESGASRQLLRTGDADRVTATVRGPAPALLLLLWGRTTLDDPALAVEGDAAAARALLAEPLTP